MDTIRGTNEPGVVLSLGKLRKPRTSSCSDARSGTEGAEGLRRTQAARADHPRRETRMNDTLGAWAAPLGLEWIPGWFRRRMAAAIPAPASTRSRPVANACGPCLPAQPRNRSAGRSTMPYSARRAPWKWCTASLSSTTTFRQWTMTMSDRGARRSIGHSMRPQASSSETQCSRVRSGPRSASDLCRTTHTAGRRTRRHLDTWE